MEEDQSQTMRFVRTDGLQTGETVAGKYRIESVLGVGGMGTVYRVTNIFFEREFALKVLDRKCAPNAVLVKRFQNEAKAAFSLNHPNLVKVHDFGILEGGDPYLVMDLVLGETLADVIKKQAVISYDQYLPILEQICAALYYAHSNSVIHRDVKPANIMIAYTPELSVKILDFGIAKIVNEEAGQLQELTRTGEIFGSPLYMSPEQCSGGIIDHRTDIYSLGCVSYEALTGAPPHVGVNALRTMMLHQSTDVVSLTEASLGLKFSPECERVVATMLAKEPSERYSDARAIVAELHPNERNQFYVEQKRSAPLKKAKPRSAISLNAGQLAMLVCGVMLTTAGATFIGMKYLLANKSSENQDALAPNTAATTAKLSTDAAAKQAFIPSPYDNVPKIFVTLEKNSQGGMQRVIHFPQFPIGQVCLVDENYDRNQNNMLLARGPLVVPVGAMLRLLITQTLNQEVILHPQIFKQIDPTLISDLEISNNESHFTIEAAAAAGNKVESFDAAKNLPVQNATDSEGETRSANLGLSPTVASQEMLVDGEEKLLMNAQGWTNLRAITFDYATISDGIIEALSRLKKIECMHITNCESITPKFASMTMWTKMRVLEFQLYDPIFLWANPQSFHRLESLSIDTTLTPTVIKALESLPKLKILRLRQHAFKPTSALLDWLSTSKQLVDVSLDEAQLSPQQVRNILSNPNIHALRINKELESAMLSAGISDPRRLGFVTNSILD